MKRFAAIAILLLVAGAVTAPFVWMVLRPWHPPDRTDTPAAPSHEVTTEDLVRQLRHEHFLIRQAAASTLKARGWQPRDDAERAWLLAARQEWDRAAEFGSAAVEPLAVAMADPEPSIHHEALKALGRMRSDEAVRVLGDTLRRGPQHLRYWAAWALGESPCPKAADVLIAALPGLPPDSHLLAAARDALARHRDPRVLPILAKALTSDIPRERQDAACDLGSTRDVAAVPHLARALEDPDLYVRQAAAESLCEILHADAIPMLVEAVQQDRLSRYDFVGVTQDLGPPAIPALTGALRDRSADVRAAAAETLGCFQDRTAVPHLERALGDPESRVGEAAAESLCRILGTDAIPMLVAAVRDGRLDGFGFGLGSGVANSMAYLGPPAIPALLRALRDGSPKVRAVAAEALGFIPDQHVIAPLTRALEDEDESVRFAAEWALKMVRPYLEAEEGKTGN